MDSPSLGAMLVKCGMALLIQLNVRSERSAILEYSNLELIFIFIFIFHFMIVNFVVLKSFTPKVLVLSCTKVARSSVQYLSRVLLEHRSEKRTSLCMRHRTKLPLSLLPGLWHRYCMRWWPDVTWYYCDVWRWRFTIISRVGVKGKTKM